VFYPANPWAHKNHARLFSALRRLGSERGIAPVVVCSGRLEGESRTTAGIAARAGLPPSRLVDLGFIDEEALPALYRHARLTVFPSLFEGFGLPVAEAMACGCPVVCSRSTSLPEIGQGAARYFDPASEASMAEAIHSAWSDEGLRHRMIATGLERAAQLRWERLVPSLVDTYRAVDAAARPDVVPGAARLVARTL
jgi:glycosyltransferase involved in cell wall biosynthesis